MTHEELGKHFAKHLCDLTPSTIAAIANDLTLAIDDGAYAIKNSLPRNLDGATTAIALWHYLYEYLVLSEGEPETLDLCNCPETF